MAAEITREELLLLGRCPFFRGADEALLRRVPGALCYGGLLVWNILLSNLQVMGVVLSPKAREIRPRLVYFPSPVDTAPAAAAEFETVTGAPAAEYVPVAMYDVAVSASAQEAIAEAGSVQVAISVPGVADGTQAVAIVWDRNGNSRTVPVRIVNGVVYLTVTSSGPVMIMVRNQVAAQG